MMEENKANPNNLRHLNNSRSFNEDNSDLRTIVEDLRSELFDVRSDFKKMNS